MTTEHFGHCENFNIFDAENGVITGHESIPNPGHKPGFLPNYLGDLGVNVVISGGMGQGAIDIFNARGIEVITGAAGSAEDCAKRYLAGELVSTGSVCTSMSMRTNVAVIIMATATQNDAKISVRRFCAGPFCALARGAVAGV